MISNTTYTIVDQMSQVQTSITWLSITNNKTNGMVEDIKRKIYIFRFKIRNRLRFFNIMIMVILYLCSIFDTLSEFEFCQCYTLLDWVDFTNRLLGSIRSRIYILKIAKPEIGVEFISMYWFWWMNCFLFYLIACVCYKP